MKTTKFGSCSELSSISGKNKIGLSITQGGGGIIKKPSFFIVFLTRHCGLW